MLQHCEVDEEPMATFRLIVAAIIVGIVGSAVCAIGAVLLSDDAPAPLADTTQSPEEPYSRDYAEGWCSQYGRDCIATEDRLRCDCWSTRELPQDKSLDYQDGWCTAAHVNESCFIIAGICHCPSTITIEIRIP